MAKRRVFFIHRDGNSGAVFVKEGIFFVDQGGGSEVWGRAWRPVTATSIEEARQIGERVLSRPSRSRAICEEKWFDHQGSSEPTAVRACKNPAAVCREHWTSLQAVVEALSPTEAERSEAGEGGGGGAGLGALSEAVRAARGVDPSVKRRGFA